MFVTVQVYASKPALPTPSMRAFRDVLSVRWTIDTFDIYLLSQHHRLEVEMNTLLADIMFFVSGAAFMAAFDGWTGIPASTIQIWLMLVVGAAAVIVGGYLRKSE